MTDNRQTRSLYPLLRMGARDNKPCMLIKQQNYMWCTFTKQTTGPIPHHSPAASGPPPAPEPTPASTSTSSSNATPALPTENLIDLDTPAPAHIHGLMAELNINK